MMKNSYVDDFSVEVEINVSYFLKCNNLWVKKKNEGIEFIVFNPIFKILD